MMIYLSCQAKASEFHPTSSGEASEDVLNGKVLWSELCFEKITLNSGVKEGL